MELKGNTVLITGGSSGIGLELAKVMTENRNTVIICSRSKEKLDAAKKIIPSLHTIPCDISDRKQCEKLFETVYNAFPGLNILINNAAIVHKSGFHSDNTILDKADREIRTNYYAPVVLTKLFLPLLEKNRNPEIVYVTTGLVYAPKAAYPLYCSTKAALHSFVQTLRFQLKTYKIKITEVIMTLVDTPFHDGNSPEMAVSPEKAVQEMVEGMAKGRSEIRIGNVKLLYYISRIAPGCAFKKINSIQ
jgi:uncharacterized oxidoreductase